MRIILRIPGSDILKVLSFETQEEAEARLVRYINESAVEPEFYRVILPGGPGDIILRKIRVDPATVVSSTIIESASFEDDV